MSKKIKICFVDPKAYPLFNTDVKKVFGGIEVYFYFLATEIAKDEDYEVSFIVADYDQPEEETIKGVRLIKSVNFSKNFLIGAVRIWRAFNKANAQMYINATISAGMFLTAFYCWLKSKLFLYRTANSDSCDGTYLRQHRIFGYLYKKALRSAKQVFVESDDEKKGLLRTTDVDSMMIPNALSLSDGKENKKGWILWVGRSAKIKNPMMFVELAEKMPDEKFTMVCQQATDDTKYGELVARAKNVKNLKFIEHVDFMEIHKHFEMAKVFVNTSDAEGFPNTFIQAGDFCAAILTHKVNPDRFIDESECGFCCNGREDRLARTLEYMLSEDRYAKMGRNAKKYVERNHDIKKITEDYKNILRSYVCPVPVDSFDHTYSLEC